MTRLIQLQDQLQGYLLRGDAGIEAHVTGSDRVPVSTRLGIYARGYTARLTEALQTNFPVLAQLLGASDFEALAVSYIRRHDSRFASIRFYGDRLAGYLAGHADYGRIPLLAELARWEWAMTEAFDAADAHTLGPDSLTDVSPEEWSDLRFQLHPSLRRLSLAWNAPQIWNAITNATPRPEPSLCAHPARWLLWRRDLEIFFRSLTDAEAAMLDAASEQRPFGQLCERLCEHVGEELAPAQAAGWLGEWLRSGLICGLRIPSSRS